MPQWSLWCCFTASASSFGKVINPCLFSSKMNNINSCFMFTPMSPGFGRGLDDVAGPRAPE